MTEYVNKSQPAKKTYHRNTYQNWLKSLKSAGFLKLKTTQKSERINNMNKENKKNKNLSF